MSITAMGRGDVLLVGALVRGIRVRRVRRHEIIVFELEEGTTKSSPGVRSTISRRDFAFIAQRLVPRNTWRGGFATREIRQPTLAERGHGVQC